MVNDVRNAKKGWGLNVDSGELIDLVKAGVIDPAMVTRSALQNAASIAKNILTTEAIVAEAAREAVRRWRRWRDARWHARHDVGSSAPYDRTAGPRLTTRPRRRFREPLARRRRGCRRPEPDRSPAGHRTVRCR